MNSIQKKEAVTLSDALKKYFKQVKLNSKLNEQLIFEAWDKVSGASAYTVRKYYCKGILYITLNSSAARVHLSMQKDVLLARINEVLASDELYDAGEDGNDTVKEIRLK